MPILFYVLCVLTLLFPAACGAAAGEGTAQGEEDPLVVRSETLEIDNKKQMVIFSGNVEAGKKDFSIRCRDLHLFYLEEGTEGAGEMENARVERVEAMGDVWITRSDGGEARSEKAVYYQKENTVILTGNPVVKQSEDFVEGSRITLFMGDKRSLVEGSKDKRIRAVIYPTKRTSASGAPAAGRGAAADLIKGGDEPLVVKARRLEIDDKRRQVRIQGEVDAKKSTFGMICREMDVYYHGDAAGAGNLRVERVEARGEVTITRADGGEARSDEAVYYQKEDKVILTGNPVVKQGEDFVEGSRITFFIGERRSIVESSGSGRVRAVIFPGRDKK